MTGNLIGSMMVRWLVVTTSRWLGGTSFQYSCSIVRGSEAITTDSTFKNVNNGYMIIHTAAKTKGRR